MYLRFGIPLIVVLNLAGGILASSSFPSDNNTPSSPSSATIGSSQDDDDDYSSNNSITGAAPLSPVGGSDNESDFTTLCESVKCEALEDVKEEIEDLRRDIMDENKCVPKFGIRSENICTRALTKFSSMAPSPPAGDETAAAYYDQKLEELESSIDAPLQVLYMKQISLLREKALSTYRSASSSAASDYEAMLKADSEFTSAAEDATRDGGDWDFASERTHLQSIMNDLASSSKMVTAERMKTAEQHSTAMQFLQQQQQMIQQLQMQLYGQSSPWNAGMAYRIPDTNFNVQGTYSQGRTNLQLSCVPDDYAQLLGPNGFSNGVGPGNLGLSLNLSI